MEPVCGRPIPGEASELSRVRLPPGCSFRVEFVFGRAISGEASELSRVRLPPGCSLLKKGLIFSRQVPVKRKATPAIEFQSKPERWPYQSPPSQRGGQGGLWTTRKPRLIKKPQERNQVNSRPGLLHQSTQNLSKKTKAIDRQPAFAQSLPAGYKGSL